MRRALALAVSLVAALTSAAPAQRDTARSVMNFYACRGHPVGDTLVVIRSFATVLDCNKKLTDSLFPKRAPAPVPPPVVTPPGSAEPSGMTTIFDGSLESSSWTRTGTASLRSDTSAPRSPPSVVRVTYPAGYQGGNAPGSVYSSLRYDAKQAYWSAWIRLSPNFQGHQSSVNKITHFWTCGINRAFVYAYGIGDSNPRASIGLQQLALPYNGSQYVNLHSSAPFVRGRWHRVELLLVANTAGQADGAVTLWLDGVRVLHHTGIGFCAAGVWSAWEGLNHSPTWGGIGDVVKSEMWLEFDHVKLSKR